MNTNQVSSSARNLFHVIGFAAMALIGSNAAWGQAGVWPEPETLRFPASGGVRSSTIYAGDFSGPTSWRVRGSWPIWVTSVAPSSGGDGDSCNITVAANPSYTSRSATIAFCTWDNVYSNTVSIQQDPAPRPQAILWTLPDQAGACDTVILSATSDSGQPVTFTASPPGIITANTLSFGGTGTVQVTASAPGSSEWAPASDTKTIMASRCSQTIAFDPPSTVPAPTPLKLVASSTSGLPVTFVAAGPATLENDTLTFTRAGHIVVTASVAVSEIYDAAQVQRTIYASRVTQSIAFDPPAVVNPGDTVELAATADSGLEVSLEVLTGPGWLSGKTLTLTAPGTVVIRAYQAGDAYYTPASDVTRYITVAGDVSRIVDPPPTLAIGGPVNGKLSLSWPAIVGRRYVLQSTARLGDAWTPLVSPQIPLIATSSLLGLDVAISEPTRFFRIGESQSPYDPPWGNIAPFRTIIHYYNWAASDVINGWMLLATIQALLPGDRLVIEAGTYELDESIQIYPQGTAAAPIWIEAAPNANVVIMAAQEPIRLGKYGPARYLCLRGLELVGGDWGIYLADCENIWIDRCRIHESRGAGIVVASANTSRLWLTRNEIWNIGQGATWGVGIYLGATTNVLSESIIALNHVRDTTDNGIQMNQGCWGNLIAANLVHDCGFTSIFVYGTGGRDRNVVENNTCFRAEYEGIRIQGECLVRNNLVIAGESSYSAFYSAADGGTPTELSVVNNTFVNSYYAAVLNSWNSGTNMIFANNACYSQAGIAIVANASLVGVTFAGNVSNGTVAGGLGGFQQGNGLADFTAVSWDGTQRDARPSPGSPLLGAGAAAYAPDVDIGFYPRSEPATAGCHGP